MPTGYTAKLMEKGQTFEEFAMTCARAFGACVEMRDDPLDAPIPEKFKPSSYHLEQIESDKRELALLESMDAKAREAFGVEEKVAAIKSLQSCIEKSEAEDARIDTMADHVAMWEPPTEKHQELKRFMLDQLNISRNGSSYYYDSLDKVNAKSPLQFYEQELTRLKTGIQYHTEAHQKEVERAESRTEWVRALRDSLKTPVAA